MDLVDEHDGVWIVAQLLDDALEALLEITAILGASQQGTHVQRIDVGLGENLRDVAFNNPPGQAFGNGRLADPGFADQQRIVLAPAAQGLDDAFKFLVAADQWVDLALQRQCVEVDRILLKGTGLFLFALGFDFALGRRLLLRYLADAV